ncbi:MAG: hypothetical protein K6B69_03035 [Lachnospiraceae bacterium]|nr:hypothetical protein [Lachnospiraceae bacterium]
MNEAQSVITAEFATESVRDGVWVSRIGGKPFPAAQTADSYTQDGLCRIDQVYLPRKLNLTGLKKEAEQATEADIQKWKKETEQALNRDREKREQDREVFVGKSTGWQEALGSAVKSTMKSWDLRTAAGIRMLRKKWFKWMPENIRRRKKL